MEKAETGTPAPKSRLGRVLFIAVCIVFLGYAILAGVSAVRIPAAERAKAACEQQAFSKRQRLDCEATALQRESQRQDAAR